MADLAPGAKQDDYGLSINGATSPENRYLVEGLAVNNPSYGIAGTPLSARFVKEIRVVSAGYMAEHGRSTGGLLDVVTKSGTGEFHGSAWLDFSPGALEGQRAPVPVLNQTIQTRRNVDLVHSFGADAGGPILRDRLWFYGGALFSATRGQVEQTLHRRRLDPSRPLIDDTGVPHPDYIDDNVMDRVHGRYAVTRLFQALGHHTAKAGLEIEHSIATRTKAYSGTVRYSENASGSAFNEQRRYGFSTGPDTPVVQSLQRASVSSTQIGAFVQDSWHFLDTVTVNLGLRYDSQYLFGDGGGLRLSLPYQLSPRVGAVYDFTRTGRSRVFAHYARYYEAVPLDIADRAFPGEGQIGARRRAAYCDPGSGDCGGPSLASRGRVFGTSFDPDQYWFSRGASGTPVDPGIEPQATDEIVVGAEYELFRGARAGVVYTHTSLANAIEDMSLGRPRPVHGEALEGLHAGRLHGCLQHVQLPGGDGGRRGLHVLRGGSHRRRQARPGARRQARAPPIRPGLLRAEPQFRPAHSIPAAPHLPFRRERELLM